MRIFSRHLSLALLTRYSGGEASQEEIRRIRDHLRGCEKCRGRLDFLRGIEQAAQEIPSPRAPAGLLDEVLARRRAGERLILPLQTPPAPQLTRKLALALALASVVVGIIAVLLISTSGSVSAGATTLRVLPVHPELGRQLSFEFRSASGLANEKQLRLRGRYRAPDEGSPRTGLGSPLSAELKREGRGFFRGRLFLPPSAVYALFSVEDTAATRVATRGGQLWEVLVYDDNGRPLFPALRQKLFVLQRRNWEAALATARQMTEFYPDRAEGWYARLALERQITAPSHLDSLLLFHRRRFGRLERLALAAAQDPNSEVAALARYARALGERDAATRWAHLLARVNPAHPFAIQNRIVTAARRHAGDPPGYLKALDAEWDRVGPALELLAKQGFQTAKAIGDSRAILEWADRYEGAWPDLAPGIATDLAEIPALRAEGIARLRRALAQLKVADDDSRRLDQSIGMYRSSLHRRERRILGALGMALAESGKIRAGLDTMALAAAEGWDPALFRRLGEVRLAIGDTVGALPLYAYVAADPLSPKALADSLRADVGATLDAWQRRLDEAEAELERRVAGQRGGEGLPADVRLADGEGGVHRLGDLVDGQTTLLLLWSRSSYPALRDLARLPEFQEKLYRFGVRLLTVLNEPSSPEVAEFLRCHGYGFPVLFDVEGDGARVSPGWPTPQYLVIDPPGRIQFKTADLRDAVRRAIVLSRKEAAAP